MKDSLPEETPRAHRSPNQKNWMFPQRPQRRGKLYQSRISDEDSEGASKIVVRMVLVLILIHIVVIGGVWVRGSLKKDETGTIVQNPAAIAATTPVQTPTPVTPVPTPAVATVPETPAPTPAIPVAEEPAAPAPAVAQAPAVAEPAPVAVDPIPVAADPDESGDDMAGLPAGPVRHIVATGDTWETIARDNGCSVDALHKANPNAVLASGSSLLIPTKGSDPSKVAATTPTRQAPTGEVYILKKGETLSKVGRMYKVSVPALMKANNLTDNDVKRLKPGTEIRIPKKK
jgi:LysM repeat protein